MSRSPDRPSLADKIRHGGPTILHGSSTTIALPCEAGRRCPAICSGGLLTIGDTSVRLSCEHARNLVERAREAIDATVLGSLPIPSGQTPSQSGRTIQ